MADNTILNTGAGGNTIRTIDRGPAKTQVMQLDAGGQAGELLVSAANPLPISVSSTFGPIPVSGTVTVSSITAPVTVTGAVTVSGTPTIQGTVTANQGTAAAGSGAWPIVVTDTANAIVKPGDVANNAIRMNMVASSIAFGGTHSSFGAAFPALGTAIGFKDSAGTNMAAGNLDVSGNVMVNVAAGSAANSAASATGGAVPADADYIGASVAGTLTGLTATNNTGKISLDCNITGGSAGNGAASNTGSAVPAQADYAGLNVGGTLRGRTGANPTGTTYSAHTDFTSISGVLLTTFVPVGGEVAAGSSDSGNPVKIGTKAVNMGANPGAVTSAQRANVPSNLHGIPFVQPGHPNVVTVRANITAAQTNLILVDAGGAGHKIVVTRCRVALDAASTNINFVIGLAQTTTPTTTGVIMANPGMPAGTQDKEGDGSGILGCGADDDDLLITSSVPTGGSFDVAVTYYILPA